MELYKKGMVLLPIMCAGTTGGNRDGGWQPNDPGKADEKAAPGTVKKMCAGIGVSGE